MEKAVEMNPQSYLYWGNLADAYQETPGRAAEAIRTYRKAIELTRQRLAMNPEQADLRASLAKYYAGAREKDKALAEIAIARRDAPVHPKVLFKAASVYEQCGERENAISALDLALKSGYSWEEARRSPELAELLKDPRWAPLSPDRGAGKRQ
jgi:tetratricopeptide (TPR) repeat protein